MQLIDRLIFKSSSIPVQPLPYPNGKRSQQPREDPFDKVSVPQVSSEEEDDPFRLPSMINLSYPYLTDPETLKECMNDPIMIKTNYFKAHLCIKRHSFLAPQQRRSLAEEMYARYPPSAFQIPYLNHGASRGRELAQRQVSDESQPSDSAGDRVVAGTAEINNGGREDDDISPIHMASGTGNRKVLMRMLRIFDVNFPDREGRTPLMYAVIGNDGHVIDLLCKYGANLNCADYDGRSAVHWAAYYGRIGILKQLIRLGAHPWMHDNEGRTPLHWATGNESTECLEFLLDIATAFELNEPDNELMTCVHWSCFHNHVKHLRLILKKRGVNVSKLDAEGKTPLHWCTSHKDVTCAKMLLELDSDIVNVADIEYRTALHLACAENNLNLVQLLLSFDACDVNAVDNTKRTPLHWSAVSGHQQLVNLLLDNADDSLKDVSGATPLHYACTKNHSQCVAAFLARRNASYLPDDEGKHPLIWAVVKGHVQTVRLLLENQVNCNFADLEGNMALHVAAYAGQTHCISLLLEHGAQVDTRNSQMHTPLFNCVEKGYAEITNILIQANADVNQKDSESRSPIHYASLFGHLPVVSILISNKADINLKDNYGKTPLHCSAFNGHNEVVKYLIESGSNIHDRDNENLTALHWAVLSGKHQTSELLLIEGADPNASDRNLNIITPLDIASEAKHNQCINILKQYGGKTLDMLKYQMATRIQKLWRGYLGRKLFTSSMKSDMVFQRQKRNTAAVVIQRFLRKHMKTPQEPKGLSKSINSSFVNLSLHQNQKLASSFSNHSLRSNGSQANLQDIEQILCQKKELEQLQRETEMKLRDLSMELKKFTQDVPATETTSIVDTFEPISFAGNDEFAVTMSTAEREYFQMQQKRRKEEEEVNRRDK